MNWFQDFIQRFGGKACCQRLFMSVDGLTMSSAFSGIGAADVAIHTIQCGLEHVLGKKPRIRNLFAVEFLAQSQEELLLLPTKPECLFNDMCDIINDNVKSALYKKKDRMPFEDLARVAMHKIFCKTCIPCKLHGNCETLRADVHVAGPPCIHYSPMGLRRGLVGGTSLCFLCWVAQRRRLRERAILHENVPEFKVEILERFFSDLYILQTVVFNSAYLGHACNRTRRLTWMLLKSEVVLPIQQPWPETIPLFFRTLRMSWEAYLIADDEELNAEIEWSRNRPASAWDTAMAQQNEFQRLNDKGLLTDWFKSLTEWEQTNALAYYAMNINGKPLAMLGQNALKHKMHNNGDDKLFTIVKNAHIIYA